jgi:hypothetical protein
MFQLASSEEQDAEAQEEASWTVQMRDALKHFVDAISDSTRQLTLAAERFAGESLRLIDDATRAARESAETSSHMAAAARDAAEEARRSADSLQGALNDAKDHLLSETRASIDAALSEARELQTAGENSVQKSQAMLVETEKASREAQIAAGHVDEVYSEVAAIVAGAREASEETRGVAARIETTVEGVSAAVDAARLAADEAREAAETTKLGISESAAAADASREAAARAAEAAEQAQASVPTATAEPDLAGPQVQSLLERLEGDYQLLTSLVQELAGRMSAIASSAAAQLDTDEGAPVLSEDASPQAPQSVVSWTLASETAAEQQPEAAGSEAPTGSWTAPELEAQVVDSEPASTVSSWPAAEPVTVVPSWTGEETISPEDGDVAVSAGSQPDEAPEVVPLWRDIEPSATESRLDAWTAGDDEQTGAAEQGSASPVDEQAPPAATWTSQPAWPVPYPTPEAEAAQSWPSASPSGVVESDLLFGRIKVYVAPVSDFDRLLRLDSALSRLGSVQSVTLADFTDQQVTFNIDLASQVSAPDLAQELRDASGFELDVESVDNGAVTLRLG